MLLVKPFIGISSAKVPRWKNQGRMGGIVGGVVGISWTTGRGSDIKLRLCFLTFQAVVFFEERETL